MDCFFAPSANGKILPEVVISISVVKTIKTNCLILCTIEFNM